MSEMRTQLVETATALLADGTATIEAFAEAGFGQLLTPEAEGGFGGDWGDSAEVLRLVGFHQPRLDVASLIVGHSELDGALATTALIGGALQRALELAIDHANTRVQFGKPLGKQQAVQQSLALMAEEVAAVAVAAQAAAKARDAGDAAFEIGCAKLRANRAAGIGGAIAHQVHGAIGFTQDYPLHHYTAKLVEWRSAHGNDAYWAEQVGRFALERGGAGLWTEITRRSDAL
jgi:acyl-CoA dehydrogenase